MPHLQRQPAERRTRSSTAPPPEVVDPVWILKALAALLLLAAIFGYATLFWLFARGQWQLVLSPSRQVIATPSKMGLGAEEIRFSPDASGQPQLDGWWIPADSGSAPAALVLHDGSGSLSNALPQAQALHGAGLNVLLFDYRGFGSSAGKHPTQALMEQDSEAALAWLQQQRHLAPDRIIIFGSGLGASLATRLAEQHHGLAAVILENADGDTESRIRRDSRARMVPVGWLFHEKFPLADHLHTLETPKLLISWTTSLKPPLAYERAASPKMTVELHPGDEAALHASLRRFLDTYISQTPPRP